MGGEVRFAFPDFLGIPKNVISVNPVNHWIPFAFSICLNSLGLLCGLLFLRFCFHLLEMFFFLRIVAIVVDGKVLSRAGGARAYTTICTVQPCCISRRRIDTAIGIVFII